MDKINRTLVLTQEEVDRLMDLLNILKTDPDAQKLAERILNQ